MKGSPPPLGVPLIVKTACSTAVFAREVHIGDIHVPAVHELLKMISDKGFISSIDIPVPDSACFASMAVLGPPFWVSTLPSG
jgi:hypothetical protein